MLIILNEAPTQEEIFALEARYKRLHGDRGDANTVPDQCESCNGTLNQVSESMKVEQWSFAVKSRESGLWICSSCKAFEDLRDELSEESWSYDSWQDSTEQEAW